ncbi:MAG: hypothetical protein ACRD0U_03695 [Acidimicrobiales bacterium]
MTRRPSSQPDAVRVRSLVLMDRQGTIAGRTAFTDGRSIGEPPTEGLAVDGLRRALGLH